MADTPNDVETGRSHVFMTPIVLVDCPEMKIEVEVDPYGRLISLSPHINITRLEPERRQLLQAWVERAALWVDALVTGAYDRAGLAADVLSQIPANEHFHLERAFCVAVIDAEATMAKALSGGVQHG